MDTQQENKISLGISDLRISPIGLGAWSWGDRLWWNYGKDYNEADIEKAFQASIDAGINLIDTAELYGSGKSEKILGELIKRTDKRLIITTKFFPWPWRLTRSQLIRALKNSLKRLDIDQVDLYLIHWPRGSAPIKTWMNALADAIEQGLTRLVGISNYNLSQMREAHQILAQRYIPLTSNQIEYSLIQRSAERTGLLDACHELGVTPVAYSPLGMGLLTGKYTVAKPPPGIRGRRYRAELAKLAPLIGVMREIGEAHRINGEARTPAQVALNWVICKGAVPIPGAKNAQQAQQNAGALGWALTQDEVHMLDHASEPFN
jgi:aryl-alcohol dehydrogenase-like predicted oxidoreductase